MDTLDTLTDTLLSRLVWTSAQAVFLIGAVWLISRLLPRLSSAMRCALWWLVGVQLVIGLCWSAPLELPLLKPATPTSVAVQQTSASSPLDNSAVEDIGESAAVPLSESTLAAKGGWTMHWRHTLLSLWLAVLIAQALIALRQWRSARRLLRESHAPDKSMRLVCEEQARRMGLRTTPTLRLSADISSPQVTGLWRPVVLLPADQRLSAAEIAMALSHEMAHLRRGDLWLGWIPVIAQRLFFFHPLVLWAMREYALQREAACDEQVMTQGAADPQAYGQLLLRLGVIRPPHAGLAGASPTFHNLKRRLTMLQRNPHLSRRSAPAWVLIALIALIGVLPYRVTAGSTEPTSPQSSLPAPPPPPQAPPMQPPPAPPALPHAPPPPPALPPAPPAPPAPPMHGSGFSMHHVSIDTATDSDEGFALFNGDTVTINGNKRDVAVAKRLQKGDQPMLWFRHGDKAWLVRDKATLDRARAIYQPIAEIADDQSRLAEKQAELAGRQAGIAARSAGVAERQAAVAEQQAQLVEQNADRSTRASAAVEAHQRTLQAQQDALSREQQRLQEHVGTTQSELSAQQAALSRQQVKLSQRQQQASQHANLQIKQLMDGARANGLAQPAAAR